MKRIYLLALLITTTFNLNVFAQKSGVFAGKHWEIYSSDFSYYLKVDGVKVQNRPYDELKPMFATENNMYFRMKENNHFGIISIKGEMILPDEYGYIELLECKDWQPSQEELSRCISKQDISKDFDDQRGGDYFLIRVRNGDPEGLMDKNFKWIFPFGKAEAFTPVRVFNKNCIICGPHWRKRGLYDSNGNEIIAPDFSRLDKIGDNYLEYKLNGYAGVLTFSNGELKELIPSTRGYTTISYSKNFKRFQYEMNGYKGECDITGKQISKIPTETSKQPTSSSSSTSNNNSKAGDKKNTVVVEHHRDPVPVQQWQACIGCGGMGTIGCDGCGGSGTKYYGDKLGRCSRCNGRKKITCNVCYGNKGQYITVYQ